MTMLKYVVQFVEISSFNFVKIFSLETRHLVYTLIMRKINKILLVKGYY